jgi:hypothetical protein
MAKGKCLLFFRAGCRVFSKPPVMRKCGCPILTLTVRITGLSPQHLAHTERVNDTSTSFPGMTISICTDHKKSLSSQDPQCNIPNWVFPPSCYKVRLWFSFALHHINKPAQLSYQSSSRTTLCWLAHCFPNKLLAYPIFFSWWILLPRCGTRNLQHSSYMPFILQYPCLTFLPLLLWCYDISMGLCTWNSLSTLVPFSEGISIKGTDA